MLLHILAKTPLHVWGILAFLAYRGVLASRERELTPTRMIVIPVLMLVLALQSIATQFGVTGVGMAAWLSGAACVVLQRLARGRTSISAGVKAGTLRIHGSWTPLAMMMTVFLVKYALAVVLAIRPGMAGEAVFAVTACGLLGVCNGYFLGQLVRELASARRILRPGQANGVPSTAADDALHAEKRLKEGMDRSAAVLEAYPS